MKKILILLLIVGCDIFESSNWIGWSDYYSGNWEVISEYIIISEEENNTTSQISFTEIDSIHISPTETFKFKSFTEFKASTTEEFSNEFCPHTSFCNNEPTTKNETYSNYTPTFNYDSLFQDCPENIKECDPEECIKLNNNNTVVFISPDSTEWMLMASQLPLLTYNSSEVIGLPNSMKGFKDLNTYSNEIINDLAVFPYINNEYSYFYQDCQSRLNIFSRINSDSSLIIIDRKCRVDKDYIDEELYLNYEIKMETYLKWYTNCTYSHVVTSLDYIDENFNCDNFPSYPCEHLIRPKYPKYKYIKHNLLIKKQLNYID